MTDRLATLIRAGIAQHRDTAGVDCGALADMKAGPQIRSSASEPVVLSEGRRIRYVWSTEAVDRMGDIVRQNWDLTHFTKNPVALWNHDHGQVLGRAVDFGVSFGAQRQLQGTIEFAPEGTDPLIDSRYKLAEAGYLPGTSVGFLPTKTDPVRDAETRAELGLGDYGVVFEENQLLEISVVSVPANPEAVASGLKEYVERGVISAAEAEVVARDTPPTERELERALGTMDESSVRDWRQRDVALIDANAIFAALDTVEKSLRDEILKLAESVQKQPHSLGDATGVDRQVDRPGSGREWDWGEVLDELVEGTSEALARAHNGQTKENPNG